MAAFINKPFVKEYNEKGEVTNFPKGGFFNMYPNRKTRREKLQKQPFLGNSKSNKITVSGVFKYRRHVQVVGNKVINHFLKIN